MILDLNRVNYCFVGTTLPGTLKLLPGPYKEQQQVVVGDQAGVLQVFSIKKEDTHVHFKTLPTDKITTVRLGGVGPSADKIFIAMENKVRAFNRKGKLFLSFDLNLTEPIKSMYVSGSDLLVCGNHVFNHYRDGKNLGSYLCGDSIVDVVALCPNNTNRMIAVLACSGRVLRLLEHCRVRQTVQLDSVPTVLYVPEKTHGDVLLCGFADGKTTLIYINHFGMDVKESVLIKGDLNASAVTALDMFDMNGEGRNDLLVGRRDGTVQVFCIPDEPEVCNEVRQIYSENFQESISSIQGGCVGQNGFTELVIGTYTGRIFGLTTQCVKLSVSDNADVLANSLSVDMRQRIARLNNEIEDLEQKVHKERERYQQSTQSMSDGVSAIPMLPVNDSMILSSEDGSYHLSIEIPTPIEFVLLQSDVPVELMDVDKSTAVVSFSACDSTSANKMLATYRCQVDTNRVDLRLRTIESHQGTLLAYVTPSLPPKVSQVRQYTLRPLSMHMRVHSAGGGGDAGDGGARRPYNTLLLRGAFSHAEMHNWMGQCVPELPEKMLVPQAMADGGEKRDAPDVVDGENVYYFRNVYAGTMLLCSYSKGTAQFQTDNISTLSILKDVLTKNATKKRIKLEITTEINDASLPHMIRLFDAQLQRSARHRHDYRLLRALLELDVRDEAELNVLCAEWQAILGRKQEILADERTQSVQLERIVALLSNCYRDRSRLRGIGVGERLTRFVELLTGYNTHDLEEFLGEEGKGTTDGGGGVGGGGGGGVGGFVGGVTDDYHGDLEDV